MHAKHALSAALMLLLAACSTPAAAPTAAPAAAAKAPATAAPAPTSAPAAVATSVLAASAQPTQAEAVVSTVAPVVATTAPATAAAPTAPQGNKINLNTANNNQLLSVPNSGNRMLREFLEYRPYTSILQFRKEIGKYVNAQQVADYEKYLFVPVDPNKADAATLQQLPGVTADVAAKLIAARPYANKGAFVKQLNDTVGQDNAGSGAYMIDGQ